MPWRISPLRKFQAAAAVGVAFGFFYASDPRASIYEYAVIPAIRALWGPEESHRLAIDMMRYPFLNPRVPQWWLSELDPKHDLEAELFASRDNKRVRPLYLGTPVGMAAGFDKNGEAIDSLFQLGFSWVEIGSVTPKPQPGNPKPRVFRLEKDRAIINRYGFNSDGQAAVLARLKIRAARGYAQAPGQVLAVNIGKNKDGDEVEDYVSGVRAFGPYADALVVNVSSPNTPGLRDLQNEDKLRGLLTTLVQERDSLPLNELPPLVVKIAPDLTPQEITSMAKAIKDSKVDGVIVGNTTVSRLGLSESPYNTETGGLSGAPVKPREIRALRTLRKAVGPGLTILGCGGIFTGEDALDYARAGANAVQLYTSFAYNGPGVPSVIAEEILEELKGQSWRQFVADKALSAK